METRRKADGRGAQTEWPLLLTASESWRFLGIGRTRWWQLQAMGLLPPPVNLPGRRQWSRDELTAWVARRQALAEVK